MGGTRLTSLGLVALGGMIGTLARYALDSVIVDAVIPVGILTINLSGAFLLGLLIESLALGGPDDGRRRSLRLFFGTGVLGGYTTYSMLATGIARLLIEHQIAAALGYGLATLVFGALASWTGIVAAQRWRGRR